MPKRFLSLDDLNNMPQPQWLIEGMFEKSSLVMLAGPPNSFKSFLLIDWMLCMASGRKWLNRPTVTCKVAYALGEGKASLVKRIWAWIKYNDLSEEELDRVRANFRVTFDVPQLAAASSTTNFLSDLESEGFVPEVVAIDTFARSFVGKDENDAKDVGVWVESADKLRQKGYAVIFLHHTKKNTEFGVQYRGSTAIKGAMDTTFTLAREKNICTLTCDKQKDHDEGPDLTFRKQAIQVTHADSSLVLIPSIKIDTQFSEENNQHEVDKEEFATILLEDASYEHDSDRAKILAKRYGGTEGAASTYLSRLGKKLEHKIQYITEIN